MSLGQKLKAPFKTYKGLITLMFFYEVILTLFLSTFSKPMVDRFGDVPILENIFPLMDMDPARHADRAIMLYHAVAIPFLVIVALMVLDWFVARPQYEAQAKWGMIIGGLTASIFAIDFAYFSENWVSHGLFIFGQAITSSNGIIFSFRP